MAVCALLRVEDFLAVSALNTKMVLVLLLNHGKCPFAIVRTFAYIGCQLGECGQVAVPGNSMHGADMTGGCLPGRQSNIAAFRGPFAHSVPGAWSHFRQQVTEAAVAV